MASDPILIDRQVCCLLDSGGASKTANIVYIILAR